MQSQNSLALAEDVELVLVKKQFNNPAVVPRLVPRKDMEGREQRAVRETRPASGVRFMELTDGNTQVSPVDGLEKAGFQLVGAICETRQRTAGKGEYYVVIYTFARKLQSSVNQSFLESRAAILAELRLLCQGTFWQRVNGYKNPLYRAGAPVPGKSVIVIDCSGRVPAVDEKGEPILVWPKGAAQRQAGDVKVPIEASNAVVVEDGLIGF